MFRWPCLVQFGYAWCNFDPYVKHCDLSRIGSWTLHEKCSRCFLEKNLESLRIFSALWMQISIFYPKTPRHEPLTRNICLVVLSRSGNFEMFWCIVGAVLEFFSEK